jgi:hypothetical protein
MIHLTVLMSVLGHKACRRGRSASAGELRRLSLDERTCMPSPQQVGLVGRQRPVPPNPNRRVRSRFTPPERRKSETHAGSAPRNALNFLHSHNLTKMAVVQLRQRKWPERGEKWPEMGLSAGPVVRTYRRECPNSAPFRPGPKAGKRMSLMGRLAEGAGFEAQVRRWRSDGFSSRVSWNRGPLFLAPVLHTSRAGWRSTVLRAVLRGAAALAWKTLEILGIRWRHVAQHDLDRSDLNH